MINEKVGTGDQISFILNGKPITPSPPQQKWECPRCGVDRFKQPCPSPNQIVDCPMVARAL